MAAFVTRMRHYRFGSSENELDAIKVLLVWIVVLRRGYYIGDENRFRLHWSAKRRVRKTTASDGKPSTLREGGRGPGVSSGIRTHVGKSSDKISTCLDVSCAY